MSSGLEIIEHASLRGLNTLAVVAHARYLVTVADLAQLREALAWAAQRRLDTLVLGGGSNLVFAGDYDGLAVHMAIRERSWQQVSGDNATLVLGAGENWHEAVLYAARSGYRGIENLALIPGTAGAAPVQNIGAYGVELSDTLDTVTVLDRETMEVVELTAADCAFGYRDSVFKHRPGRYIILEVRLALSRSRALKLGYRDLQDYLGEVDAASLTPLAVAEAVMAVRRRKLPDPAVLPNAGSFFKNPVIARARFTPLQDQFPDIVFYPADNGVKLAAAWLIDQAGWKGFRNARVGIHNRQALVLINHSDGTGADVLALAEEVRQSVQNRFGVELEMEPGVVGRR